MKTYLVKNWFDGNPERMTPEFIENSVTLVKKKLPNIPVNKFSPDIKTTGVYVTGTSKESAFAKITKLGWKYYDKLHKEKERREHETIQKFIYLKNRKSLVQYIQYLFNDLELDPTLLVETFKIQDNLDDEESYIPLFKNLKVSQIRHRPRKYPCIMYVWIQDVVDFRMGTDRFRLVQYQSLKGMKGFE